MESIDSQLANPPLELTSDVGEIARLLFATGSVDATLVRIVELAVETIEGCAFAGIFLLEGETVVTPVFTDPVVSIIDRLQHANSEGPCLAAIAQGLAFYADDLEIDTRWPAFGPEAAAAGIRSALAVPLAASGVVGALNLYARYPAAFGVVDRARGAMLASLSGVALTVARVHEDEERQVENLASALATREVIGQAQGILIERERISADAAFEILRRASQHLNYKLRDVAQDLVDTGERPEPPPRPGRNLWGANTQRSITRR
jgi:GAF domain-containing protein